ncbi:helix-turn-helix domain-containing protein [Streptomyces sp. NPDC088246]|uniref:helix-turn-helix domain-containing protein n=1 Tax=Streptomyces sp. NPDC088246 TaxID=3365842 RepID=UPI0037F7761F
MQGTTVNAWVRTRRLEVVREELAQAGAAHRSIAAVAARWGFTNPSHFSRTFRDTSAQQLHHHVVVVVAPRDEPPCAQGPQRVAVHHDDLHRTQQ